MTYGPDHKWFFNGRLDIRKGSRRSLILIGCFLAVLIVTIYSYWTDTVPFRNTPTCSEGFANSISPCLQDKSVLIKDVFDNKPNRDRSKYKTESFKPHVVEPIAISSPENTALETNELINTNSAAKDTVHEIKTVSDAKDSIVNTEVKLKETVLLDTHPNTEVYKKAILTESIILNPELLEDEAYTSESDYFITNNEEYASEDTDQDIIWDDPRLDILHMPRPEFSAKFKNPCWYESLPSPNPYKNNRYTSYSSAAKQVLAKLTKKWEELYEEEEDPKRLRCLPYFLIIGQPKCGSTDLFWKIAKHPDIDTPPIKELHWWSRNRQGRIFSYKKIIPFEDYVDMFDRAATHIEERVFNQSQQQTSPPTSQIVTGEASVSVLWDNHDWTKLPENENQEEPAYVIPHYVHHVIPDVKLIVILREPVERMYSDYLYFHASNKSPDDFHRAVVNAIQCYQNCTQKHSIRYCAYSARVTNKAKIRLKVGLYSVFLKDWLNIFPREQLFILRLEDYSNDPINNIKQIYKFLDVRKITPEEEALILDSPISNTRKAADKKLGGMHDATRALLEQFYRPFNVELATLLQDKKFLWLDKY